MGGGGGGGGKDPGPAPGKLQIVIYFQEEKTGTNFPREAIRWSCLDPHTHVRRWNFIFCLFILSRAN